MKWYLAILLLITSFSIHAQECDYRVNSVSGMDGTRLVITEPVELTGNFGKGALEAWTTVNGDTAIILAFVIYSPEDIPLVKGDKVSLIIGEESSIDFEIYQDPVQSTSTPKKLTCLVFLSPEEISALESKLITGIRFSGETYQHEGKIKKKNYGSIATLIRCVREYLTD